MADQRWVSTLRSKPLRIVTISPMSNDQGTLEGQLDRRFVVAGFFREGELKPQARRGEDRDFNLRFRREVRHTAEACLAGQGLQW